VAIPIHWGTLQPIGSELFSPRFMVEPARAFSRFASHLAPNVRTAILGLGESITL
jgi:hypothetical protein